MLCHPDCARLKSRRQASSATLAQRKALSHDACSPAAGLARAGAGVGHVRHSVFFTLPVSHSKAPNKEAGAGDSDDGDAAAFIEPIGLFAVAVRCERVPETGLAAR